MSAGIRRERVSFLRRSRTQRDDGGFDTTAVVDSTVWASVKPVAANEREQAGRLFGSTTYIINILSDDKPSAFTTDWLVGWDTAPGGAVYFEVTAIRQNVKRAMGLDIVAQTADEVPNISGASGDPSLDFSNADNSQYVPLLA